MNPRTIAIIVALAVAAASLILPPDQGVASPEASLAESRATQLHPATGDRGADPPDDMWYCDHTTGPQTCRAVVGCALEAFACAGLCDQDDPKCLGYCEKHLPECLPYPSVAVGAW